MTGYIVHLSASRIPASIGNKARRLRFLSQHGYLTPDTCVCTWEAYLQYLADSPQLIQMLSAELAAKFDPACLYAVRSSANIEDGLVHSFAGQFKSVLDVQGHDRILQALWSIWASTRTPSVEAYLVKCGLDPRQLKMAALIQVMVPPVVSGVAFSKNPLTGLNETVIEAVQGSGELLVRKGLTPDRWVYSRGQWSARPEHDAIDQALIEEVIAQTRSIAKVYGQPIDLEWVYDGRCLYWVQLREITSLKNINLYSNHISKEMLPGLIKPLIWSVNIPMVVGVHHQILQELIGHNDLKPDRLVKAFYYRAYFNMGIIGDVLEALGFQRDLFEMMMGLGVADDEKPRFKLSRQTLRHLPRLLRFTATQMWLGRRIEASLPRLNQTYRQFQSADIARLSEAELLAQIDQLFTTTQETTYYNFLGPMFMFMYNGVLKRSLAKQGVDFQRFDLTAGMAELEDYDPNVHLRALSGQYRALDAETQGQISRSSYAEFQALPGIGPFQSSVARFLDRFGHLSDSGNDFSAVPWRETPDLILQMIVNYQALDDKPLKKTRYEELALPLMRRPMFSLAYQRARQFRYYREAVSSTYTYGYGLFRPYFQALADRLVARGVLSVRDDIFYLYLDEVRSMVERRTNTDYAAVIAERRREMETYRSVTVPPIIVGDQPPPIGQAAADILHGTPTSRGRYTGRVRVVCGLQDFGKLQDGEVLVIPYSDAGWTPLFSKAGAVIAESGGILSHSSIVAREYNIPAVVSVPDACSLAIGTRVTVDGYSGEITVHA